MQPLRHFLLIVVLLFAQLAAGAHAVEHAADNKAALATHICELCLAAHDLGAALPSLAALPPVLLVHLVPDLLAAPGRNALPPPLACQRGPPSR